MATAPASSAEVHSIVRNRIEAIIDACKSFGFSSELVAKLELGKIEVTGVELDEQEEGELLPGRNATSTVEVELVADSSMLNLSGNVHGGCIAWLIDMCSSLPIHACAAGGRWVTSGVSTNIDVHYLSAVPNGMKFKIVSSIMRIGRSTAWIECRILDPNGKLLVFGTHTKQDVPFAGQLKANL